MDKLLEYKPWLNKEPFCLENIEKMIEEYRLNNSGIFDYIPPINYHKPDPEMEILFNRIREFVKTDSAPVDKALTYDDDIDKALSGGIKRGEMICLKGYSSLGMRAMMPGMTAVASHAVMPKPMIIDTPDSFDYTREIVHRLDHLDGMPMVAMTEPSSHRSSWFDAIPSEELMMRIGRNGKSNYMYDILHNIKHYMVGSQPLEHGLGNTYVVRRIKERLGQDINEPITFPVIEKVKTNKYEY